MEPDLNQARRRAKELQRAARAGDAQALARMRDDRSPRLADAQRAVANDLGFPSWPALVAMVRANSVGCGDSAGVEPESAVLRETGLSYTPGHRVRVSLRRRGNRYDMNDMGEAVRLAGRAPGWREAAEGAVDALGWNMNRDGVVTMQTIEGRNVDAFVYCTGQASVAVFKAILELEG